ncbi:NADPH-dependent F420 reductase [Rouxiella sp. WC2420]|uniref:NADPH-dependent F420 reductase n=1 Tax=Rouxiella sp. WC2420 TaxID=3234145 RepID=A0AB39VLL4_9GAMM
MSIISIIGSGGMAAALASLSAKAGHSVEIMSRDAAKARALAEQVGAAATAGTYGTTPAGNIVILAIPYASAVSVMTDFGEALKGKVIIDITNPISADATKLVAPAGSSGAQEISMLAPAGSHVVKAFNTVFSHVLARGTHLDAFIAADGLEAKVSVSTFITSLGLSPLDVGGLHMARTLEAVGLLLISIARNGAGTFDIAFKVNPA